MASFSTYTTNIFHRQQHHLLRRCSISTASSLFKTHFTRQFPVPLQKYSNYRPMASHVSVAATVAEEEEDSTSTSATSSGVKGWEEFAEKISGEWDGFEADFTVEGKPLELPESVVPGAYREWEVKVFDWQTQCPTLAQLNESPSLIYKNIKLLPTVGCEADAATVYSIDERMLDDSSVFGYQYSSGCYVANWPVNDKTFELEHCLIDPRDKESRVRITQVLELKDSEMRLQGIKVFVEQWYGPFRNGDQLGGCAIRDSAFGTTQPLVASEVTGVWQGLTSVATFGASQNAIQQLGNECVREAIRDEGDLILLPKQLWCSVRRAQNGESYCEVGWLLNQGRAITSKCTFSSTNELQEISVSNETTNLVV